MGHDLLEQECRTFTRYLTGSLPTDYVIGKYRHFHQVSGLTAQRIDAVLVRVASWGPWWTSLADTYAVRFRKHGVLRKKLVLTLGLLECTPPAFEYLDDTDRVSLPVLYLKLGWRVGMHVAMLFVSMFLFLPIHLGAGSGKDQRR